MTCQCGKPTKGARCRPCTLIWLNSDPEIRKRRQKGLKRVAGDPARRPARLEAARKANITKRANPEYMALIAENLRRVQPLSVTPEALARRDTVKAGLALSDARLPWCPREYRALYRYWTNSRHRGAAEARAIVVEIIRADKRAAAKVRKNAAARAKRLRERQEREAAAAWKIALRTMSFEDKLCAVAEGRLTISTWASPRRDEGRTLGGVSCGWMG